MAKDIRDSSDTELEITRVHDMSETDTAIEPCSTTERLGRRIKRHPIFSVVIASTVTGFLFWTSSEYLGLLMHDVEQPHIDEKQDLIINIVQEDVAELKDTCESMEQEQMQQRIILTEIKAAIERLE